MTGFTGIVLCGGASRRMGADKAALTLGGRTFLELQVHKLREAGAAEVLLSGGDTALPGTRLIPDVYPRRGPLGGLHACLGEARYPSCLAVSVDVPLVPADLLRHLAEVHLAGDADVTMLPGEPLIAVYRRELVPVMEELIREGGAPVRALLDRVRVTEVPYTGDPALLRNCNTPEDYETICGRPISPDGME